MTPWVFRPRRIHTAGETSTNGVVIKLVLFHPAGTGATIYNGWIDSLEHIFQESVKDEHIDGLEVYPIELPGRGMRMKEPLLTTMHDVVAGATDAVVDVVFSHMNTMAKKEECDEGGQEEEQDAARRSKTPKVVIFGHSLGGWIAFEVVCELERRYGASLDKSLLCLIVSAIRSPTLAGVEHDIDTTAMHTLNEEEFWQVMERRYGKNPELEHPSIRKFMYPVLRADFTISETYTRDMPILQRPVPLFVTGGTSDVRYTEDMLHAWSSCTASGMFKVQMFPGGHSYLFSTNDGGCQRDHCSFVLKTIEHVLQEHQHDGQQLEVAAVQEEEEAKMMPRTLSDGESTMCMPPGTTTMSWSSMSQEEGSVMTNRHQDDEKEEERDGEGSSQLETWQSRTQGCKCSIM